MVGRVMIALGAALAAAAPVAAQEHKMGGHKMGDGMEMGMMMVTPWREMNGFHSLLHLIHQPMMKSGDLAPARRNAGLLADAAEKWAQSTAPAECKAPADIGEQVGSVATEARALAKLVEANGTDDEVKAAIGKLHDRFQTAHMACMPMGMKGMPGMKGMKMRDTTPPQ